MLRLSRFYFINKFIMANSDPKCIPVTVAFRQSELKKWLALAKKKNKGKGPLLHVAALEYMEKNS